MIKLDEITSFENILLVFALFIAILLFSLIADFSVIGLKSLLKINPPEDITVLNIGIMIVFLTMFLVSLIFASDLIKIDNKLNKIMQQNKLDIEKKDIDALILFSIGFVFASILIIPKFLNPPPIPDYATRFSYFLLSSLSVFALFHFLVFPSIFLMKARLNKIEEHIINNKKKMKFFN